MSLQHCVRPFCHKSRPQSLQEVPVQTSHTQEAGPLACPQQGWPPPLPPGSLRGQPCSLSCQGQGKGPNGGPHTTSTNLIFINQLNLFSLDRYTTKMAALNLGFSGSPEHREASPSLKPAPRLSSPDARPLQQTHLHTCGRAACTSELQPHSHPATSSCWGASPQASSTVTFSRRTQGSGPHRPYG